MTWLWRIAFSLSLATPAFSGNVTIAVRMSHSRVPAVRQGRDYSGVVVWLDPVEARPVGPVRQARLTMKQKEKRFSPHVLAAQVGATVQFPNLDAIFHSAFSNFSGQIFDFGLYAPGTTRDVTFTRPGVVRIFCNIHPVMAGVIVVLKYPWFDVSGPSGEMVIRGVPPGDYRLHVFHERARQETLGALERRISVPPGDLQLPPLEISEIGYIEAPHKNKYGFEYPPDGGATYPMGRK
jgi:plastocyanin